MHGKRWMIWVVAVVLSGCTLSAGSDGADVMITATLRATPPATLAAVIQTSAPAPPTETPTETPTASPTVPPVLVIEPTHTPEIILSPTATASPTRTAAATATDTATTAPTRTATGAATDTATPDTVSQAEIDATVVMLLEATNTANTATAAARPTDTVTATQTPTATITVTPTPPPSLTPLPTAIPPTRTHPGPPTVIPFDDGSGDLIPGTGNTSTTAYSPIPGLDALPHTLYYLSDVGDMNQVFRLQIGLPYPEQLTYSPTGVRAFDVALDGTLAYIAWGGDAVIGGLPFMPRNNPSDLITALAWSPDGSWLAYTIRTVGAVESDGQAEYPNDGLWLRNTLTGTLTQLSPNDYKESTRRIWGSSLEWKPDGTEILARYTYPFGISYAHVNIATGVVIPLDDSFDPVLDAIPFATWTPDGQAIIASDRWIRRIDLATGTYQTLLNADAGFHAVDATQQSDGAISFVRLEVDRSTHIYRLFPGQTEPVVLVQLNDFFGQASILWDATETIAIVSGDSPLYIDPNGVQYDLTPLTGLVGSPQWGPTFKKNDRARVHIEGDPLNVRATPGGEWLASLPDGVQVTIVGGPVELDGYTWWQIRVANGVTGWSVEAITEEDGSRLQTLQPVPK